MLDELKSEQKLYVFLQRIFAREVDAPLLADLAAIQPPKADDAVSSAIAMMVTAVQEGMRDRDALLEDLEVEYARLFIGPRNPPAVPFASYYLSESRALMTDETIEVRKIYLANGMVLEKLYSTPDDHIAIELEFLARLTAEMIEAHAAGNHARCNEVQKTREGFIAGHMKLWIPQFVDAVDKSDAHPLYRGAALLLEEGVMRQ